jgi:hypothetical protein
MIAALVSEYRKLFSTRLWWVLALCAVGYLALFSTLLTLTLPGLMVVSTWSDDFGLTATVLAHQMAFDMIAGASVFPLLVGSLSITQEYRHKTISATFLAEPRRQVVVGAKLIASLAMGAAYGLICLAATMIPVTLGLSALGAPLGLDEPETWSRLGRAGLNLTLWAPLGVGFGVLLRSQAFTIVVALLLTQVIEPFLLMVAAFTQVNWPWLPYLPGVAGGSIQAASSQTSLDLADSFTLVGGDGLYQPLPWLAAVFVLLGWAALLAGLGYFATTRRDVS